MADPTLYLYTSLTAGSSHIITATSRMETILKANRVPFRAIDCATDEKARQLWSRRSRGKKLPGLVKYGQVIGDLEQVEEWNEFGELVDQIDDVSDVFGDTPMTDTPMEPPVNTIPPSLLKPIVEKPAGSAHPMSRTSSESKHISISEPTEKKARSDGQTSKAVTEQASLAMAMRNLGAEAAAKVGQLKSVAAKATTPSREATASDTSKPDATPVAAAVPVTKKIDPSETTPNPAQTKSGSDASLESSTAEEKQSITAAKTPAQLEAEGVRMASVDKAPPNVEAATAADTSDVPLADSSATTTKSTEEQVLSLRRTSSIAKAKSSLSQETNINDVSSEDSEDNESAHKKAAAQAVANVEKEKEEDPTNSSVAPAPLESKILEEDESPVQRSTSEKAPESTLESTDDISATSTGQSVSKTHRGSSISSAPEEEIKEVERKNAIIEEDEEDEEEEDDDEDEDDEDEEEEDDDEDENKDEDEYDEEEDDEDEETKAKKSKTESEETVKKVSAVDEHEGESLKSVKPQDTKAAEPADAEKSVGD